MEQNRTARAFLSLLSTEELTELFYIVNITERRADRELFSFTYRVYNRIIQNQIDEVEFKRVSGSSTRKL